jgi:4a-hydroxytetrahydrobiopterin dehydratase
LTAERFDSRTLAADSHCVKRPQKLAAADIERALAALPGWSLRDDRLYREIRFGSFVEAFGFMASMALVSESMNHHPDWSNVYSRVEINLWTHDAGGITELDVQWATRAQTLL